MLSEKKTSKNREETAMRKKKAMAAALGINLAVCVLAGCEKTPEESIVKEKGADSIRQYESTEETKGGLRERLNAPKHYKNESVYENGGLVIDTDADVFVPDVDTVNTYAVSAKELNQELIDQVTEIFFKGDKIYQGVAYHNWSKEDIQNQITTLKKYKAEGNLDPYQYGKDENGNLQFHIDEVIERYEEDLKTAPDEREKIEVTPALNLEYWTGKGDERAKEVDPDHFYGVAETEGRAYNYVIDYALKPDIRFHIEKIRDEIKDPMEFSGWTEGEFILGNKESPNYIPEESIQNVLNISFEDAKKTAEETIAKIDSGLTLTHWDYSVFYHGEQGAKEDNMLDAGYLFQFSRNLNGVPVTHEISQGGALEDMDSTLVPWSYERYSIVVGDDGIQTADLINPYNIGEIKTENVKLMNFDSIINIYEQMMEVTNADILNYEKKRIYNIRNIRFGYTRIYDPVSDNDTGLLIPVWDFFGGFDSEDLDGSQTNRNSGERSTQSFMTINAIDGSVIDRGLGY